jgi:hypothetical protein
MNRLAFGLILLFAGAPARAEILAQAPGQSRAAPRSDPAARTVTEVECRRLVEQRHPPGTLSRNRQERQQLVDACIANGGRLP